ncbi:MAG: hypothetical protein AAF193_08510, partial [Bacteroidota bacterium]
LPIGYGPSITAIPNQTTEYILAVHSICGITNCQSITLDPISSGYPCLDSLDAPDFSVSLDPQDALWTLSSTGFQDSIARVIKDSTDIDVYFVASNGEAGPVTLNLKNLPANFDLQAQILDANWSWVKTQASFNSGQIDETVTIQLDPGDQGIIVAVWPEGYWPNQKGNAYSCDPYTLTISYGAASSGPCVDLDEPCDYGAILTPSGIPTMTGSQGYSFSFSSKILDHTDRDGFSFPVNLGPGESGTLDVVLTFENDQDYTLQDHLVLIGGSWVSGGGTSANNGDGVSEVLQVAIDETVHEYIAMVYWKDYYGNITPSSPINTNCSDYTITLNWTPLGAPIGGCITLDTEPSGYGNMIQPSGLPQLTAANAGIYTVTGLLHDSTDLDAIFAPVSIGSNVFGNLTVTLTLPDSSVNYNLAVHEEKMPGWVWSDPYQNNTGTGQSESVSLSLDDSTGKVIAIIMGEGYWGGNGDYDPNCG